MRYRIVIIGARDEGQEHNALHCSVSVKVENTPINYVRKGLYIKWVPSGHAGLLPRDVTLYGGPFESIPGCEQTLPSNCEDDKRTHQISSRPLGVLSKLFLEVVSSCMSPGLLLTGFNIL